MNWKEFESFCASLFRAKGYSVAENIVLKKPRMQVDLLARNGSVALAVDCKHWARAGGGDALARIAKAQSLRAISLRSRRPGLEPLAAVILVMTSGDEKFSEGAAVVPIQSLFDFLDHVESFSGLLRFH